MSTWSIFWIALFSASVLKTLIRCTIVKPKPELSEKQFDRLTKIIETAAKNINIVVENKKK